MDEVKPFDIPKREVWAAFRKVRANHGAAGVDGQSIADFEADLANNLYELWNRLSSGSEPPSAGATSGYSEGGWRYAPVGHSNCRGPSRPGSCPSLPGAAFGAGVPCQLIWLQARQIGDRRRAPSSSALLALRLGARSRRKGLFRQHRLGADAQGGPSSYEPTVGAALHRALAKGSDREGGWQRCAAKVGNSSGRGHKPHPGESVSALCVRCVDGENLSSNPVRALRG